jgi:hypothetical protein
MASRTGAPVRLTYQLAVVVFLNPPAPLLTITGFQRGLAGVSFPMRPDK